MRIIWSLWEVVTGMHNQGARELHMFVVSTCVRWSSVVNACVCHLVGIKGYLKWLSRCMFHCIAAAENMGCH